MESNNALHLWLVRAASCAACHLGTSKWPKGGTAACRWSVEVGPKEEFKDSRKCEVLVQTGGVVQKLLMCVHVCTRRCSEAHRVCTRCSEAPAVCTNQVGPNALLQELHAHLLHRISIADCRPSESPSPTLKQQTPQMAAGSSLGLLAAVLALLAASGAIGCDFRAVAVACGPGELCGAGQMDVPREVPRPWRGTPPTPQGPPRGS